ncbi:MAG: PAS domain S-box protein [Gammaproteobacteria bacterium]|nr:PAS domain S-box protein [Gammaproteobacteria bacterium]
MFYSAQPVSLDAIMQMDSGSWKTVSQFGNHGFRQGEYWLRLLIHNENTAPVTKIISTTYPSHDQVDFYVFDQQQTLLQTWQLGDTRPLKDVPLMDKHPAIEVQLNSQQSQTILVRVQSDNALVLNVDVLSPQEHQSRVHYQGIFSGLIYGILLVMALYNFGLAVSMRDKAYYFYVFYVVTFIGFILTLSGDGYFYLWGDFPQLNRLLIPLLAGTLIIPSLLFPYYLLNVAERAPQVVWFYRITAVIALVYLCLIPVMGIATSIVVVNSLSSVLSLSMLLMGIYLSVLKIPFARIYTLAWFILLLGLSVLSLSSLGVIENNLLTRNAGLLGGVIEAIILSLALAQRIAQERNEKLSAVNDAVRNRKLFQELFDQAPIGIVRFHLNGKLVAINPALVKMLGFKSPEVAIEHADVQSNVLTDHAAVKQQLLLFGKVLDREMALKRADGEVIPCSVSLHLYTENNNQYIEAYITDVSERIEAQQVRDLMEQERLTSMEQLVTGVAHEVNTPLGVNITSMSHIKEILDEVDNEMQQRSLTRDKFQSFIADSQQLVKIVEHNLQKISNLVRRFKLVSVGQTDKVMMNLRQHLDLSLHSHLFIGHDIEVVLNCANNISLETYPAAWDIIMEQLIENSIVHGFNEQQIQKKITVDVQRLDSGEWSFEYQDNGRGIAPDMLNRVFDPFVTTKRGSSDHAGLGLYRIYNIVHRVLEGEVEVTSERGFQLRITFAANWDRTQAQA